MKSSLARFGAAAFLVAVGLAPLAPRVTLADGAGFTVSQTSGSTVVAESGGTDTFTVVLNTLPTGAVVLTLSSNDTGEATVSPSSLTFTTSNWNLTQTVTVTGVADNTVDGNQTAAITLIVDPGLSANEYDTLPQQTVNVTILDVDGAGFSVIATDGSTKVTEAGGTDTVSVVLNKQPAANVVIGASSRDTGEVTVSPAFVTFTPANWSVPQTVTLTGVDDTEDDGNQTTLVDFFVFDAESAVEYRTVFDQAISVVTLDNDGVQEGDGQGNTDADGDGHKGGTRPGWGCGDRNHEHIGPAGGGKENPCKDRDDNNNAGSANTQTVTGNEGPGHGHGKAKGLDKNGDNPGKSHRSDQADNGHGRGKGNR